MRILGIDPGLQRTGFGVIDTCGARLDYVTCGIIATDPKAQTAQRLREIFDGITQLCERYAPQEAAIEIVFVNVNAQSTLLLGQARGACLTALSVGGLPIAEYTALQMKKAVAGHGRAAKAQVQEMVRRILRLNAVPRHDAADALGLAVTHAHAARTLAVLERVGALQRRPGGMYRGR